jgi:(p)ppGpp synthase/HD superfamily hydrolase
MALMRDSIKALHFAAEAHKNQRRKDTNKTPYINHPIHVATILSNCGVTDANTLMAAILHDTVEDTPVTFDDIFYAFGGKVCSIVRDCTDDKSLDKVTRKKLQIDHAKTICHEAKLVKLADKLSNISDLDSNPPPSWTKEEIEGYLVWSFAVSKCLHLEAVDVSRQLMNMLNIIYDKHGFNKLSNSALNEKLETYYKSIDKSE